MGSLGQTVNMKTTFIFLACLLVITGANLRKECNNKAEEISSKDCKQYCNANSPANDYFDCVNCFEKHQDYDEECKGVKLEKECFKTEEDVARDDCKCVISTPGDSCYNCINKRRYMNYRESGLACKMLVDMGVSYPPYHPPTSDAVDDWMDY